MAAHFSSAENICEGENCQSITDVTYYVKEKKKLCDDCASKEECIGKVRKGRPNLYCEKHDGEEIKLYCKTHNVAVCQLCATIDHRDMSCMQQDIEGAIMDSRARLNILKEKAKDKLELCRVIGVQIHQCRTDTDTHLQALKDEVDAVINEAIQTDKDKEKEDAAKINQDTDEKNQKLQDEIQKIKEKIGKNDEEREKRLELNRTNAERRREPIDNKEHGLQTDIKNIAEEKKRKISELEKAWQDNTKTTKTTVQTLDTVLENDQNVVKDGHRVKTSVSDELKKPLNEGEVKQITDTISGVRFVKGAGRKKYDGRIDGYDGEWKLIDTLNVGHIIAQPFPPDHRVFIIDRQGAQREISHSGVILNACIDPMTDDLYVVTSDDEYGTCVIDQVMSGDEIEKRRVASFPLSTELDSLEDRECHLLSSRVLMTSSGKLFACDGDNILVFKNRFIL
ncbi:uncharacterized protein LOC115927634 [Strongylocentrotus purpuratus]|uniref:B box-type domain-containing protein n=1 Tax=Strongylocentrotus purpuratus TaxID=7668 RepID=A0A7M7T2R1_STRPU|nr:uncharacterized protein LOC115927634 [Strongylocentrotus purpuratus]